MRASATHGAAAEDGRESAADDPTRPICQGNIEKSWRGQRWIR